ncbi:type II toxin-antitoxin system RelE/ParE family toxin [Patescibacteria group bacterium]|nr:type II toxin-antitoxin system RelE/ParE family toxin [Patescibacteria group bacterium]
MAWDIILFETARGEKPVEEFIKSLDSSTIAKVAHEIDLLEKHGPFLGMPHARKLCKELYELRIRGKQEIRIIYLFFKRNIYLLHAFKKKKQKTPRKEISTAKKRLVVLTMT